MTKKVTGRRTPNGRGPKIAIKDGYLVGNNRGIPKIRGLVFPKKDDGTYDTQAHPILGYFPMDEAYPLCGTQHKDFLVEEDFRKVHNLVWKQLNDNNKNTEYGWKSDAWIKDWESSIKSMQSNPFYLENQEDLGPIEIIPKVRRFSIDKKSDAPSLMDFICQV